MQNTKEEVYKKIAERVLEKAELPTEVVDILLLLHECNIHIPKEFYDKGIKKIVELGGKFNIASLEYVAREQGAEIKIPKEKELYEKAVLKAIEEGDADRVKGIIEIAREHGIKITLSKKAYEKGVRAALERGEAHDAEEFIEFAEKHGIKVELPKEKEVYEKGATVAAKESSRKDLKKIVEMAKEQGIEEIRIPKEAYEKGIRKLVEVGFVDFIEDILEVAGQNEKIEIPKERELYEKGAARRAKEGFFGWIGIQEIIEYAKQQGVELNLKKIYEEGVAGVLSRGDFENAEKIIGLAKEQGIEISPEAYKKGFRKALSESDFLYAERIIEFAKQKGIEIKTKDPLELMASILAFHDQELSHTEAARRTHLKRAKNYGLTYEDIINVDLADYLDVPKEKRLDLSFEEKDYKLVAKGILDEDGVTEGKYILGVDKDNKPTLVLDATLGEHKDIAFKYLVIPDGGGKMKIDKENKRIEVYGSSKAFGEADKEKTVEYLRRAFKDYEIKIEEKE